jgi:hypothetical protein
MFAINTISRTGLLPGNIPGEVSARVDYQCRRLVAFIHCRQYKETRKEAQLNLHHDSLRTREK